MFHVSGESAWVPPAIVLGDMEELSLSVEKETACVLDKTTITILAYVSSLVQETKDGTF